MNNDPDWTLYRTMLAVSDEGSLSAAARRLGLTQPTVARHIDALETTLNGRLFVRSQRGLDPTDLALALDPHARAMSTAAAALLRTASGAPGEISGTVRVTASDVVGVEHLPAILSQLRREHPALVIELSLSDRVDDLIQREADIAVRNTDPMQGALLARRLANVDLGLHAHRDYLARRGTPSRLSELSSHDVIGFDIETPALRAMMTALEGFDRRAFALRTDSNIAQFAAIRAGFGIGLCQAEIAQRNPAVVRVLPDFAIPLPMWIVMHEDLKTNTRYRVVFDALVEGLSQE